MLAPPILEGKLNYQNCVAIHLTFFSLKKFDATAIVILETMKQVLVAPPPFITLGGILLFCEKAGEDAKKVRAFEVRCSFPLFDAKVGGLLENASQLS